MNIWQSYKQERGCLRHFAHLANTLLKDEESTSETNIIIIIIIIMNRSVCHKILTSEALHGAMQGVSEQRKKRKPGKRGMSLA